MSPPLAQGRGAQTPKPVELDRHVLTQYAGFLLAQSGLHFTQSNMSDLEHGIRMTMESTGIDSPTRLLAQMAAQGDQAKALFDALARNVTIGETYFLRYPDQFTALQKDIFPELIKERRNQKDLYLRLWSAGCSSGEEAYSMAIVLRDLLPDFERWRIQILATDINRESLTRAETGDYGAWSFRGVTDDVITRHFIPRADGRMFSVHPQLKKVVRFQYLNLGDDCYPSLLTQTTSMDFVFCRNVLIYFNEKSASHVIHRLHSSLIDGGTLMVGPVEPNEMMFRQFDSRFAYGTMIYSRRRETPDVVEEVKQAAAKAVHSKTPLPGTITAPPKILPKVAAVPRKKRSSDANDPAAFIQLAQAAWKDGHHERAGNHARRAVELDPRLGEGHFLLALIDADRGNFEAAEEHVERATACSPLEVRVHHLASIIASERSDWESSITHLKKCVFLDRHFVLGHFGLAVALRETQNTGESARYLKNVLAELENVSDDATLPGVDDIAAGWLKKVARKYLRDIEDARGK